MELYIKICQNQLPPLFVESRALFLRTWYMVHDFRVCMWEDLSGDPWCRAGHTLKGFNQLAVLAIHPVRWEATVVWLVDDGFHQVRFFRASI